MECRPGCAACCIAISISSPLPGMPGGKPAGQACIHLDRDLSCRIHGQADYPPVCAGLRPCLEICGTNREEAMALITAMEAATRPD